MNSFPYRQIHLDFHTSEAIPRVGDNFVPREFAATLKKARVDSITCFARCHHGWLYYDSKEFPELIHPSLSNHNILKEQIEACHQEGIRVPIYTTVQWDGLMSARHPEFCVIDPEGKLDGHKPHKAGFYTFLCVNTPYRDFLKQHLKEILTTLPTDGIFMDIVQERDCSCRYCQEGMASQGLNPRLKEDRMTYARWMIREFREDITAFIRQYNEDCSIFYNGSHVGPAIRPSLGDYSHLEVESLPSGGWGYSHFPLVSRYARGLNKEFCGMTGKFHTYWGDFHSFKNRAALEYECFNMLAMGGGCSIGDQLHPDGKLEPAVYDLIGSVYSSVEAKEPWCRGAEALADIGVFNLEEWSHEELPVAMLGALGLLEECGMQFDLIDARSDFSRYKLLIMPDHVPVDLDLGDKLEEYLAGGGRILATFESGLSPEKERFATEAFGVEKRKDPFLDDQDEEPAGKYYFTNDFCDFVYPEGELFEGIPRAEHSLYIRGLTTEVQNDKSRVLARTRVPYFYRTSEHFCSHQQTPSSGLEGGPAVVLTEGVLYYSHPLFTIFRKKGPRWVKLMVKNGIEMLIQPRILHNGPSTLKVMVNRQAGENRWIIHLLHYIPQRRCEQIEVVEDVIPLRDIELKLLTDENPLSVSIVPEEREIPFTRAGDRVEFSLPVLDGHGMIEVQF